MKANKIAQIHQKINMHHELVQRVHKDNKGETSVRLNEEMPEAKNLNEVHAPKHHSPE